MAGIIVTDIALYLDIQIKHIGGTCKPFLYTHIVNGRDSTSNLLRPCNVEASCIVLLNVYIYW